jgi:hemoglobin-like flavoprotein
MRTTYENDWNNQDSSRAGLGAVVDRPVLHRWAGRDPNTDLLSRDGCYRGGSYHCLLLECLLLEYELRRIRRFHRRRTGQTVPQQCAVPGAGIAYAGAHPAGNEVVMDDRQRHLIRETFDRIRPLKGRAGELFYQNLFALAPDVAPMFGNTPMPAQGGKLMQVFEYVVERLEQWDDTTGQLEELGARHVPLGVRPDHYAAVGTALVTTLHAVLGGEFTEEAEEAWEEFYTDLSLVMERGSRRAAEEKAIEDKRRTT